MRRESGNLLLEHGFTRLRPDVGTDRSTQYTGRHDGQVVRLWGSGVYAGSAHEGVFVNRFLFQPRYARHQADAWQDPALLKRAPLLWDAVALGQLCRWIAAYERAVLERCGVGYRRVCLGGFPPSVSHAEDIATAWQDLAALLDLLHTRAKSFAACTSQPALALNPLIATTGC